MVAVTHPRGTPQSMFGLDRRFNVIKINRIGNKLGLAGIVAILLSIGLVANQYAAEFRCSQPISVPIHSSRFPTTR